MKAKFNFKDLEDQLKLVCVFKNKKPHDFFSAFQIAIENGIGKKQVIVDALEVYCAEKNAKIKAFDDIE